MIAVDPAERHFAGVVAMDGPSGTGKSTVARRLATELNAAYLDTGAMYRAATLAVLRAGVALDDAARITAVATSSQIDISTDPAHPSVRLDGVAVDTEIRSGPVTAAVSAVSAVPAVRTWLVAAQRELIGRGGIVVEGRDIATVVWPQALPKIYLTATPTARARRRAGELTRAAAETAATAGAANTGPVNTDAVNIDAVNIEAVNIDAVAADIERRDRLDSSRATSPLVKAADAIEVDTTELGIDEVVKRLVDIVTAGPDA